MQMGPIFQPQRKPVPANGSPSELLKYLFRSREKAQITGYSDVVDVQNAAREPYKTQSTNL